MVNPNKVTERLFQSPSKYIQGPYAIQNAAKYLRPLGKAPLLICDNIVWEIAGKALVRSLEQESAFSVHRAVFGGEAARAEADRLAALAHAASTDFVIALGGGKTSDTSKAVAAALAQQVAVVPTTASTDAPCSAIAVFYHPEGGAFDCYRVFDRNPSVVLVDTTVIARAPVRFLAAGMGDAIATNAEARACGSSVNCGGGLQTEVCRAVGERCEEIVFRYGRQAYEANRAGVVTPALEAVVEANTLLSGLGFECWLLSASCFRNDLPTGPRWSPHLRARSVHEFMLSVNLPVTFEMLGIPKVRDEELRCVAELACVSGETVWAMDRVINVDFVVDAMKAADAAGRGYIGRRGWRKD